jgi:hypothetical protein
MKDLLYMVTTNQLIKPENKRIIYGKNLMLEKKKNESSLTGKCLIAAYNNSEESDQLSPAIYKLLNKTKRAYGFLTIFCLVEVLEKGLTPDMDLRVSSYIKNGQVLDFAAFLGLALGFSRKTYDFETLTGKCLIAAYDNPKEGNQLSPEIYKLLEKTMRAHNFLTIFCLVDGLERELEPGMDQKVSNFIKKGQVFHFRAFLALVLCSRSKR